MSIDFQNLRLSGISTQIAHYVCTSIQLLANTYQSNMIRNLSTQEVL